MAIKFKNRYSEMKKKEEFYTTPNNEQDLTDQSQLSSSNIREMAKKFGIDALISKAEKTIVDNVEIQNQLYGNDFTTMFNSKEELLNTKKKLNNIFENIPARLRKEMFNDNVAEFVHAYTTNNETKLQELNRIGLVSDKQLDMVKTYNKYQKEKEKENTYRKMFIEKLEEQKGAMYENFKKTGDIIISNSENNTNSNTDVQRSVQ